MSVVPLAGSVPVSVLADDNAATVTTQEVTEVGTQNTTVSYHQTSSYTVTIPKTITLNGDKTASYEVKVKGDIAGNESVTVVPDATVTLNDSNGNERNYYGNGSYSR